MRLEDLTGQRFGRLTVLQRAPNRARGTFWLCRCECGVEKEVNAAKLKSGNTVSCGCRRAEGLGDAMRTHGMTETRIYRTWSKMKSRCNNPTDHCYPVYGGRGITVCQEWNDSFETFYEWAIRHGYTDELTIDRIDNDKGYSPDNCQWITLSANAGKQRTDAHFAKHGHYCAIDPDGNEYRFINSKEFAAMHGLSASAIRSAVLRPTGRHKGWTFWNER